MERLVDIGQTGNFIRPRDLKQWDIPQDYLWRLYRQGLVTRSSRGVYVWADAAITENHSLAEACKRVPHGVICLLSALRFHDLTTQAPFEVWMAIDVKARAPKQEGVQLRVVRFSGEARISGVEEHLIEGVPVKVYSAAKTVADCFKYRNKIGIDVAMEALRESRRERKCTVDEIWHYAKICRLTTVIMPYLEALS